NRDWLRPIGELGDTLPLNPPAELRKSIHDGLIALSPLFRDQPFFLGPEYTLVDTFVAPLIWRLPALGIDLPKQAAPIMEYGSRLFARPAFRDSLSEQEREMREA
ncbi:MAG: glutathione S-transferase C-terminal domain-containing protein, partial [Gammaproteobacteria bacterium]|nr:glutathione S-transferase C-terminal domain-containing protein [Gammaproteobacteria bacterium]